MDYFHPPRLLRNPHLQSVVSSSALRRRVVYRRAADVLRASTAVEMQLPDQVRLMGYHSKPAGETKGLVTFFHGWEGHAGSQYVVSAAQLLFENGFEIFRLNFRDHGDTHHLNPELFHSCRLDEVVEAVRWITSRYSGARQFIVGFSLGGNFALRVAARAEAEELELERVVAVCPVLSPINTMRVLEQGPWIYRFYFLRKWRRSLAIKAQLFPELYDFGDLRALPTLTATTDFFVRDYTPFPALNDYLNGYAIVGSALSSLTVPAHIIAAEDDPVIPIADLDYVARPEVLDIKTTRWGGHCGFMQDTSLNSWIDQRIFGMLTL